MKERLKKAISPNTYFDERQIDYDIFTPDMIGHLKKRLEEALGDSMMKIPPIVDFIDEISSQLNDFKNTILSYIYKYDVNHLSLDRSLCCGCSDPEGYSFTVVFDMLTVLFSEMHYKYFVDNRSNITVKLLGECRCCNGLTHIIYLEESKEYLYRCLTCGEKTFPTCDGMNIVIRDLTCNDN